MNIRTNFIVRHFRISLNLNLTDVPTAALHPSPAQTFPLSVPGGIISELIRKRSAAYVGGELPPNGGAHAGRDWGPFDIQKEVIDLCPTECMWYEDGKLIIR